MAKPKSIHDCRTGRDFEQFFQGDENVKINPKNGSYIDFSDQDNCNHVYVPDTNRTLPKTTRELIIALMVKAGFVSLVVFAVLTFVL